MKRGSADKMDITSKDLYDDSIKKIRGAVDKGLFFDEACCLIEITDRDLRESVVNEALRLLVAELHCSGGMPLKQLALKLRLSLSRLMNVKESLEISPSGRPGVAGRQRSYLS